MGTMGAMRHLHGKSREKHQRRSIQHYIRTPIGPLLIVAIVSLVAWLRGRA